MKFLILSILSLNLMFAENYKTTINKVEQEINNLTKTYELKEFVLEQSKYYNKIIKKQPKKEIRFDSFFVLKYVYAHNNDLLFFNQLKLINKDTIAKKNFINEILSKEGLSLKYKQEYTDNLAMNICTSEKTSKLIKLGSNLIYRFSTYNKNNVVLNIVLNKEICLKYFKYIPQKLQNKLRNKIIYKYSQKQKQKKGKWKKI